MKNDFDENPRWIVAASEEYWRIPSSPIVERICVCSRRSRREDNDEDDEDEDDDEDDDDGEGGGEEEREGRRLKSNNPNLKGGELI